MEHVFEVLRELHSGLEVINCRLGRLSEAATGWDVAWLREDVGFVPQFDVASGLADYMAWHKINRVTE